MNQKIVGKTAQEVVDNLTPSAKSWISKIIPVKGEIEDNLARLAHEGKLLRTPFKNASKGDVRAIINNMDEAQNYFKGVADNLFTEQEGKKITSLLTTITPDNMDDVFKQINSVAGENAEKLERIGWLREDIQDNLNKILHSNGGKMKDMTGGIDTTVTGFNKIINAPRAYFDVTDPAKKKARITTAAVGYAGVAVGGRYLSGGTLTRDNYGQRDIAGVPFI